MAWIESHQGLERHPKLHVLMHAMGWDTDSAIGKLHRFWWWCLEYAPTGDLHGKNDSVIAGSVGLDHSIAKKFVEAMVASRWIDRDRDLGIFRVHDWLEYAGLYLRTSKFKRHPNKLAEAEAVYAVPMPADCPRTVHGQSRLPTNPPTNPPTAAAAGGEADRRTQKAKELLKSRGKS